MMPCHFQTGHYSPAFSPMFYPLEVAHWYGDTSTEFAGPFLASRNFGHVLVYRDRTLLLLNGHVMVVDLKDTINIPHVQMYVDYTHTYA